MDDECPGVGRCHGCVGWCPECGTVANVCDAPTCMRHRCARCTTMLTEDEVEFGQGTPTWCFACTIQAQMACAVEHDQDEVAAGEEVRREIERAGFNVN